MGLSLADDIINKYDAGCNCCSRFPSLLTCSFRRSNFFFINEHYKYYFEEVVTQDHVSWGKRPVLSCQISARYNSIYGDLAVESFDHYLMLKGSRDIGWSFLLGQMSI